MASGWVTAADQHGRVRYGTGAGGAPRATRRTGRTEHRAARLSGRRGAGRPRPCKGPDGTSQVETRFLVGADGAHSMVRREAGIGFAGAAYPERFLLADLDIDWDLPHDEGHIWIGDDGLVAAIPLPGERRYRVIVPLPPAYATKEYESEAEIAAEAETLLGNGRGCRSAASATRPGRRRSGSNGVRPIAIAAVRSSSRVTPRTCIVPSAVKG